MYYLFDDERIKLNPIFKERELERFYKLWDEGMDYKNIAKKMGRTHMDIVLLILDRGEVGAIKDRGTGIFGN